jgi:hypothetical protein
MNRGVFAVLWVSVFFLLGIAPTPAQADAGAAIPLNLDVPKSHQALAGWPITTGVPLKDGQVKPSDYSKLRVETEAGKALPAQFEARGKYLHSGNVKWLGISFELDPGVTRYRLVIGSEPGPPHATPVKLRKEDAGYTVTTGDFRVEVPHSGAMLSRVTLGGKEVLKQGPDDGNWLVTMDGKRHSETSRKVTVEREGPLHTTLKVEGVYEDAPLTLPSPPGGEGRVGGCGWIARLHFYAGRPDIEITHTFLWRGDHTRFKIKELALSFGLAGKATTAAVDTSDDDLGKFVARPLANGPLSVLQDSYWHFAHGDRHFSVSQGKTTVSEGQRAGAWAAAANDQALVSVAVRDLWQQFPKKLRVEPGRLTAHLWASGGQALPMDFTFEGFEAFWGKDVHQRWSTGIDKEEYLYQLKNPVAADPTGMAKTHDLLLSFDSSASLERASQTSETFDEPPLLLPDPKWIMETGVLGKLWPRDGERFPDREAYIERVWSELWTMQDDWGCYGFVYYGDGPAMAYEFDRKTGRAYARPWRYLANMAKYGVHYAAWIGYLRSGDRRFFNYARNHSRFLGDLHTSHADTASRTVGSTGYGIIPWMGPGNAQAGTPAQLSESSPLTGFGHNLYCQLIPYYLSGDDRSRDIVLSYAHHWPAFWKRFPNWKEKFVGNMNDSYSRWIFNRLEDLTALAEGTGDPRFLKEADVLADLILDLRRPDGIVPDAQTPNRPQPRNPYSTYEQYKGCNLIQYLRLSQGAACDRAKDCFLKQCQYVYRTQHQQTHTVGYRMAYAYHLTKDRRWVAYALARDEMPPPDARPTVQGARKYTTRLARSEAYDSVMSQAYLMGALAECPEAGENALLLKHIFWPETSFVFNKEAGKALTVECSASQSSTFAGPDGKPFPAEWLGTSRSYEYHHGSMQLFETREPVLYYPGIKVPAEAAAGSYRVTIKKGSMGFVQSTNAAQFGIEAPGGFMLGAGVLVRDRIAGKEPIFGYAGGRHDRYFFRVPEDARAFQIRSPVPARLILVGPDGTTVKFKADADGRIDVTVPPGAAGRLWSIKAAEITQAAFSGIVPAFSYMKPERHFVPAGTKPIEAMPRESPDPNHPAESKNQPAREGRLSAGPAPRPHPL